MKLLFFIVIDDKFCNKAAPKYESELREAVSLFLSEAMIAAFTD